MATHPFEWTPVSNASTAYSDSGAYALYTWGAAASAHADAVWTLSLSAAAARTLAEGPPGSLPLAVATAVAEFLHGPLLDNPYRVGKPLQRGLKSYHAARRGPYRVLYRIDAAKAVVHVVRIGHRSAAYRRH